MYELVQVSKSCYYIDCPAKIGMVQVGEGEAVLIDSGNDKDAGKKVLRILNEKGFRLRAIYNTHSHADHIGGNAFLQEKTGCKVYAPGMELAFVQSPILEPMFLYGGMPPKDLCHKFLMAKGSDALPLTRDVLPEGLSLLSLPGHSPSMVGFESQEGVTYLADCLASEESLEKYQVSYLVDPEAYLDTLHKVGEMKGRVCIPAHAPAGEDMSLLVQKNIETVEEILELVVSLCKEPCCLEEIIQGVFRHYHLTMDFTQYALVGSTLRSYISCLRKQGRIEPFFQEERLWWRAL